VQSAAGKLSCDKTALKRCTKTETFETDSSSLEAVQLFPILPWFIKDNSYQLLNSTVFVVFLIDYKNCSTLID